MNPRPEHYIITSQAIFGVCLLACLLVTPGHFFSRDQGGISNYGIESRTTGLYATAFIAVSLGSLLAGFKMSTNTSKQSKMRVALFILGGLYALSLISTYQYKLHEALHMLHYAAAIALFSGMLLLATWLSFVGVPDNKTKRAYIVFCIGFLLAALTFFGYLHILFAAQIISGASFAYILAHGTLALSHFQSNRVE